MQTGTKRNDEQIAKGISSLQVGIVRALLYFDIFNYPLHEDEIETVIAIKKPATNAVIDALDGLADMHYIGTKDGYYFIGEEGGKIARRIAGNTLASEKLSSAQKYAKLISYFPFVRGICISGSLSKGYMDKNSDIDYFVITEPGRLWLTRLLLTFYKKIFLLNSRKNFCINYFIDTNSLEIPDKNIFTATELSYIIPVYNYDLYKKVMDSNEWKEQYFPNFPLQENRNIVQDKKNNIKLLLEKIFRSKAGDFLDNLALKLIRSFIKKKYKPLATNEHEVNHRIKKNTSKHHPLGFQWRVLGKHEEKIKNFETEHGILLHQPEN